MKKALATISLFVYLLVTCGVIVNFHYCMNRLDSLQLYSAQDEVCGKCGMHIDDASGCCRDEVKIIKLEEDQKVHNGLVFSLAPLGPPEQFTSLYLLTSLINFPGSRHFLNHSPPLLDDSDSYIANRVFRI